MELETAGEILSMHGANTATHMNIYALSTWSTTPPPPRSELFPFSRAMMWRDWDSNPINVRLQCCCLWV